MGVGFINDMKTYKTRISDGNYRVIGGLHDNVVAKNWISVKNGEFVPSTVDRAVREIVEEGFGYTRYLEGFYKLSKDTLGVHTSG